MTNTRLIRKYVQSSMFYLKKLQSALDDDPFYGEGHGYRSDDLAHATGPEIVEALEDGVASIDMVYDWLEDRLGTLPQEAVYSISEGNGQGAVDILEEQVSMPSYVPPVIKALAKAAARS